MSKWDDVEALITQYRSELVSHDGEFTTERLPTPGRVLMRCRSGELLVAYTIEERLIVDDYVPELKEAGEFDPSEEGLAFDDAGRPIGSGDVSEAPGLA